MTVAFARTRTLAKLFADTAKPFGAVAVLDRDHEREVLAKLPVTEISGIGGRRADRLSRSAEVFSHQVRCRYAPR
jgi:DNA polymerase V